ncbi:hypothetical protein ANTRET_LOCUS7178 [Anthophora retusa]
MSDGSSSRSISENNVSASIDAEELSSQSSADKRLRRLKLSITSNITRKIKSKIPKVGYYLKRLMRLGGGRFNAETETIGSTSEVAEITESMLNCARLEISNVSEQHEQSIPEVEDSVDWLDSHVSTTVWYETHSEPTNHFMGLDSEGPSTSARTTDSNTREYQTRSMDAQTESRPMISHSVNTAEAMTTNGIFANILNRDTTVAGNILEFTEALSMQFGTQTERLRNQESRTVSLVYARREDHPELYLQSTTNGESEFSGSSMWGSEISSVSESDQPQMRNQRIGQDPPPQIQSTIINVDRIMRKPISYKDDEPSIY